MSVIVHALLALVVLGRCCAGVSVLLPTVPPTVIPSLGAAFGPPNVRVEISQGPGVVADPFDGCDDFENTDAFLGAVVVVQRGHCSFRTKVAAIQRSGGVGVVMVDTSLKPTIALQRQELFEMADDGFGADIRIPAEMITRTEGEWLVDEIRRTRNPTLLSLGHPVAVPEYHF